jgi:glutathione-regulated potassium-efflux system protein KefB
METRRAVKLGLLLSQGGEFGFVLFAAAQSSLLIEAEAASLFGASSLCRWRPRPS